MNSIRAQTSEQVDELIESLRTTVSDTGQTTTPFEYKEDWQEMYSLLSALPKPEISLTNTSDSFQVAGRTFPLELYLQHIGLIRTGGIWAPEELSADLQPGSIASMKAEVLDLCSTFGFAVTQGF